MADNKTGRHRPPQRFLDDDDVSWRSIRSAAITGRLAHRTCARSHAADMQSAIRETAS